MLSARLARRPRSAPAACGHAGKFAPVADLRRYDGPAGHPGDARLRTGGRRGRGTSAPPGWRRSTSRTCVSSSVRLATTRPCREAAALSRTAGARVLQYSSASSSPARPGHAYLAVCRNKPAPGLGVVIHRGRRSGRLYQTPVSVFAAEDGYLFALTYGPDTDWVKNVLAAGGCELRTRGHATRLTSPRLYHDESRRGIRPVERQSR